MPIFQRILKEMGHKDTKQPRKEELKLELQEYINGGAWKLEKEDEKKDKNKDDGDSGEHSPDNGELEAVLWRRGNYLTNFSKEISANDARSKVYKTFTHVDLAYKAMYPDLPNFFKTKCGYGQLKCNFDYRASYEAGDKKVTKGKTAKKPKKKSAGKAGKRAYASMPYKWTGHHLIPCGAFYQELETSGGPVKIFSEKQYVLLLLSDYDVNNGNNVIALPRAGQDFFQPVHSMILHPSNHNNYTSMVQKKLSKIADNLKELESEADKPHPEISVKIAKDLHDLEDRLWKILVKLGKTLVGAALANKKVEFSSDLNNVVGDSGAYGSLK